MGGYMYPYKVLAFDKENGTFTVDFTDIENEALNHYAPRLNGVYLAGQALEEAIQLLRKPVEELTEAEYQQRFPEDDPLTLTGGEDIEAKIEMHPPETGMLVGEAAEALLSRLRQT
jgi:hypothetical protein